MSAKTMALAERRLRLISRSAAQRDQLSWCYHQFDRPAALIGKALGIVGFLRSPLVATALTFLLVNRRKSVARLPGWISKGWRLFRLIRQGLK